MDQVLFEITKDHLETGLRGVPVGYCTTSYVDPKEGLFYRGVKIGELVHLSSEEVMCFLFEGTFDDKTKVEEFSRQLKNQAELKTDWLATLEKFPKKVHPMKAFATMILMLSEGKENLSYRAASMDVIAKLPVLVASLINFYEGWDSDASYDPHLGYIENFVNLLAVPIADKGPLLEVMKLFHILHLDHGGGNLSTFIGKAVASGLEDLYGSIAASLLALEGPRHGRANQDCLQFVQEGLDRMGKDLAVSHVEEFIRSKLSKKELIFGFGHAVLRVEDPRATLFYEYAKKNFPDNPLVKMALLLREAGVKVLKENPRIQNPYPNVDAMSGVALCVSGFDFPKYFTVLFGMSRIVGICRQIIYEREEAREGKGTPIIRPKYIYKPGSE